jgi:hypothetical protein
MNLFQTINELLFTKKDPDACLDPETYQSFQPYMTNRWGSFYSKEVALLINSTMNKYSQIRDDKSQVFKMYHYLLPKLKFKRISYAKKKKKEKSEEVEGLERIATARDMSLREVKQCVDLYESLNK